MGSGARWRTGGLPDGLRRLVEVGALPSDPEDLRVRKSVLVLSATLMAATATIWVATYAALGLWLSAAVPFAYQCASALSIANFARAKRCVFFRESQLLMSLLLPFALQWSLGGFENSSAVSLWAITAPLDALLFAGQRQSIPWFKVMAAGNHRNRWSMPRANPQSLTASVVRLAVETPEAFPNGPASARFNTIL